MRIGASLPFSVAKSIKVNHFDILNGKQVPIFFSKLHRLSENSTVTNEQASQLWDFLENIPNITFDRTKVQPNLVFGVTELLLKPLREAVAECAGVLGQILNYNTNKTIHEILFFIVSYFNEIATFEPQDMVTFTTKCGIDLAKYMEALDPEKLDIKRVKTPLNKSVWEIMNWLQGMLKSNYLIVHEAFSALLGKTMENLTFKIHSLCGVVMRDFEQTFTPIEKLKEIAQNLSKLSGIPKANQSRLKVALEQVKALEQQKKPKAIQPWMLASIMRQIYYDEPVDKKIANLLVFGRTGKTMEEFMTEFDLTLSLLKSEIWLTIIVLSPTLDKPTINGFLTQFASISMRRGWWWNSNEEEEEDEKKKKDDPKGKEEETQDDIDQNKRRATRLAEEAKIEHMKHITNLKMQRQAELEKAMRDDPDNPYNPLLNSEEKFQTTRSRVKERLKRLLDQITDEVVELTHVNKVIKSNNLSTRLTAGKVAIEQFRGSLEHQKTISDALNMVDTLLTENAQIIQEQLMPLQFEMDVLKGILDTLDRQEEILNGRVYATSTKIGVFLLIIAGIFGILYFISKTNNAWVGEVHTTLEDMRTRSSKTYTRGLVNMCENFWRQGVEKARSSSILKSWTPDSWLKEYNMNANILTDILSESLRRLTTYTNEMSAPIEATKEALIRILNRYTDFMAPYVNGLNAQLSETIIHYNQLVAKGHVLDTSEQLQRVAGLRAMIENALFDYKTVVALSSKPSTSYQIIIDKIITVNNAFSETLQMLQTKMMEGQLPEATNIYTRISSGLLNSVSLLPWAGQQIMWVLNKLKTQITPQPFDITPDRMLDLTGAGKSEAWMKAYKEVGSATIAVGVFTAAFPLLAVFHVSNLISMLWHTGGNPTVIATRFFFNALGGLTILFSSVYEVLERANIANNGLSWSFYGSVFGLLVMWMPNVALFQAVKQIIAKKISGQPSSLQINPPPNQTPETTEELRATPKLNSTPSVVNPNVFATSQEPALESPTIDPQQLQSAADSIRKRLEEMQNQPQNRGGWVNDDSDDDPDFEIKAKFVECVVCGEEARFMCSHCHKKSYCNENCGQHDWSTHKKDHVSFIKK